MANKLKHLAIKPITERERKKRRHWRSERFLNEIKERWKVNGGKKGILKKKNIKAAARMCFLGFVAMARTKGQPICASLTKSTQR